VPKRISKRPPDVNQAAFLMVERSTAAELEPTRRKKITPTEISRVMSAMGKKGGKIGGKRSLVTLTQKNGGKGH